MFLIDPIITIGYNSLMKPTIIGLLGKPLSGKDTVAQTIEQSFPGVAIISMGDMLREVRAAGPSHRFWNDLQESVTIAMNGGIAPDEPVFRCFTKLIQEKRSEGKSLFVWTGALRTEDQITMLDSWCRTNGFDERFIHISVPDDELMKRREARLELKREDDRTDAFTFRLTEYERLSAPVIKRLREEGRLIDINGVGAVETVGKRVVDTLLMHGMDPETQLPRATRR